ncbi:MAG: ligand-binding sensor domain-containing protein [Planctomycetota bacterium]
MKSATALALVAAMLAGCDATASDPTPGQGETPVAVAVTELPEPVGEEILYDRWETWGVERGVPEGKVLTVLALEDEVWAGTESGLVRIRDGRVEVLGTEHGLPHRVVTSIRRSDTTGDLWVGTFGGLARYSGGRFRTFKQADSGLINDVVYGLATEGDRVWVATAAGLSLYDVSSGSWSLYDHTNAVFHEPWIYAVCAGSGRIWIGVWGGGVVAHDPVAETWREYRDPDGEMELELVADDGPIHDVTAGVAFGDGALWQATYFGVSRFKDGRWRSWMKDTSGLPSNFVNAVHARGPWAYFSTDSGLCVTDGDRWTTYVPSATGGAVARVNEGGEATREIKLAGEIPHGFVYGASTRGGHVWMATADGLGHGWNSENEQDHDDRAPSSGAPERRKR